MEPPVDDAAGALRTVALIALAAGAIGSLGAMFVVGRNAPLVLMVLFIGWVLGPFLALLWATLNAWRWPAVMRTTLYFVGMAVTLTSLAVYGNEVWHPPASTPAFMFLIIPLATWVAMSIALAAGALVSRLHSRQ